MSFRTQHYRSSTGSDGKVKVSVTDTTSDYLISKIIAGSGIAIDQNNIGGNESLTIRATGSFSEIAVTGTINDSNVGFSASSTPTYVIINGIWYKSTGGAITWTYVGTTLTLSSPVGTGGTIWAF